MTRAAIRLHQIRDESIIAAMREPARLRMALWHQALLQHRAHPTFRVQSNSFDRTMGFTCSCMGTEQEWNVSIATLGELLPETRARVMAVLNSGFSHGAKKRRREARKADGRARALLFRYLSKPQKWELRATKAFTVTGQDGRRYLVTEGYGGNVRLIENGEPTHTLCVVPTDERIPVYDLLLAHKVLLENATAMFLRTARVRDLRTDKTYESGAYLWDNTEGVPDPEEPFARTEVARVAAAIPQDAIEEPETWVRAQLQGAEHGHDAEA